MPIVMTPRRNWKRWVLPDPTLPLEEQFFQTLCELGAGLALFVVIPLNIFQNLSPSVNRGVLVFGLVCLALAWAAHRGRYFKKTLIFALVGLLDLIWFPNAGSQGSVGLYFFMAALLIVIFFEGAWRIVGLVLLLLDIVALHLAEQTWPRLLQPFTAPIDRLVDLTSGYVISLLMSALILWVVQLGFNREKARVKGALRTLEGQEAELRAIFESSQDAIGVSMEHNLEMVNPAFLSMFGYERVDELIGGSMMDLIAPESRDVVLAARHATSLGNAVPTEYELIGQRRDGSTFPMEIHLSTYERDACSHTVANLRDLTERKRNEDERQKYEAQARRNEKMDSLGALAGGVAHDMNNVLGAVMGIASVHLVEAPEGSVLRKDMETIANACQRGGTMVKGLLGFARESLPIQREIDLNAAVREAVTLLERTTLQKIHLVVDLAPDLMVLRGDPAALGHALMNLCVNAVDAMPGGGNLTLRTRNHHDAMVVLEVVDTGSGMPKEVLDKALDPFFTTKPMGKGTGLGLPIVFGTVKAHHGKMEIQSEPGQGTQVRLYLPSHKPECQEVWPVVERRSIPVAKALNILLVDDDELIQHAVHRILRVMGHTVTTVSGGEKAVAVIEAGLSPDLVILDMNMPELDGAATLPRLRELIPNVPVVLATGRADQDATDLVSSYPLVTMLPKPFTAGELGQKVNSLSRKAGRKPTS